MEPGEAHEPDRARAPDGERVLVALLALGVAAAQLVLRDLDDSRLASFRWALEGVNPLRLLVPLTGALALALLAARAPLPPRRTAAALFVVAFSAAACTWTVPEVMVDAARYFVQAKHLALHGPLAFARAWGRELQAWTDLPLVPALHGLAFRAFGEHRAVAQALTAVLYAGTAVVTARIGRALWGDDVGLAAGALLLAIPCLLAQVPLLLVDVPTMFFVALATLAVVRGLERGGAGAVGLAGVAVALALLSKYSAWLLLSGLPALALVLRGRAPRALRAAAGMALVAGALVAGALLLQGDAWIRQLRLLAEYQAPGLRRWGESFAALFLFQVHPFVSAAALLSAWVALRRRDVRWIAVAWPVLLMLVLRVERVRYWVPAFPALALLAAYGLQVLRSASTRRAVVACAVASSLVIGLLALVPFLRRTSASNLAAAGAWLDAMGVPAAEVLTPRVPGGAVNPAVSVPLLDLQTSTPLVHACEEASAEELAAARESPLRFTWEWRCPPYYRGPASPGSAVVLVTGDPGQALPPEVERRVAGLHLERAFDADEGVFAHRTLVRVYRAALSAPPPGTASGSSR